jgi:hypothetical protein
MSHKDAPPLTPEQQRFEAHWRAYWANRPGVTPCGFGRDRHGDYLAEWASAAWEAWNAAQRPKASTEGWVRSSYKRSADSPTYFVDGLGWVVQCSLLREYGTPLIAMISAEPSSNK